LLEDIALIEADLEKQELANAKQKVANKKIINNLKRPSKAVQNSGSFSTKKLSMGPTGNKDSFQTDSAMKLRRGSSGNDLHSGKKYY
jgi:hypothetical protein